MTFSRLLRAVLFTSALLSLACGCAFDISLREYLDSRFWLPFSKQAWHFEKKNVSRISAPYAGMTKAVGNTPLAKLRLAYQHIPVSEFVKLQQALSAARADQSLSPRDREEADLLAAKIEMRAAEPDGSSDELLQSAKAKLLKFLLSSRTPEFQSEARGWLAHIYHLLGDQTAAGKIYLDELNRNGSNLSRQTLLDSLHMTYGYNGGQDLLNHLDEYFDTPEHAAFAVQMVTNPHWSRPWDRQPAPDDAGTYARITALLNKNRALLRSNTGSNALALLGMRTALRMGDPPGALRIAEMIPTRADIRDEPEFQWMLASANFVSHRFAAAESPLLRLFRSSRSSADQKAAAAYGLCGVYLKKGNSVEQIRYALWLHYAASHTPYSADIYDQSIYWAESGWDLATLLDVEAPDAALESFLTHYPDMPDARLVRYALAVRFARENRYEESAQIYDSIRASWRVPRMRQLARLYGEANRMDLAPPQLQAAKYELAAFIAANSTRIYFNDQLWNGLQNYALAAASTDSRLTRRERAAMIARERRVRDDQEEYWRVYLIFRDIVTDAGKTDVGRQAAQSALHCLRRISSRFERQSEIETADFELTKWLSQ